MGDGPYIHIALPELWVEYIPVNATGLLREDASVKELLDEVVSRRLDPASAAAKLLEREL